MEEFSTTALRATPPSSSDIRRLSRQRVWQRRDARQPLVARNFHHYRPHSAAAPPNIRPDRFLCSNEDSVDPMVPCSASLHDLIRRPHNRAGRTAAEP